MGAVTGHRARHEQPLLRKNRTRGGATSLGVRALSHYTPHPRETHACSTEARKESASESKMPPGKGGDDGRSNWLQTLTTFFSSPTFLVEL